MGKISEINNRICACGGKSQKFSISHCDDDCHGNIWEERVTFQMNLFKFCS